MNTTFPRFLSGFIELQDTTWLHGARLSLGIQPIGSKPVDIGIQTNPFRTVYANAFHNQFGLLQVNRVIPETPIKVDITSGVAKVGLQYDNTLQVNNLGQLGVKSQISTPSGEFTFDAPIFFNSVERNVSLLWDNEDFKLNDSKLALVPEIWKPRGGLKLYGSVADAVGDIGELMDFSDIDTPDTPVHLKILKLNTSDDFTQTNSKLEIRGKTPGCIPFYKIGNGFAVNSNFNYDDVTLSVRFVKIENSFSLQDGYAASVGFVNQAYQSSDNTAIDITSPQNGRRIISVRTDNTTIKIDSATNKLTSALTWEQPLSITNGQVSLNVDNSTLVKSGNTLKGNYQAGRGIKITGNTITSDEELDLTFHFPLVKAGTVVRLDMSGINPISVNDVTGKISLAIDNTLSVVAGKLSVVPKQLNGGDGILIADDQISFLGDLHHFNFTNGQTEIRLKPNGGLTSDMEGLSVDITNGDGILLESNQISFLGDLHHFNFTNGQTEIRLKPGGLIESDMEGLYVSLQGENGILYDNGMIRLLFDLNHFSLSAGDELQLNLSNTFTTSQTNGLDIKTDNSTIVKDATVGLKGGYTAKSGSAINVIGNLIGENITASNGVTRVGNDIRGSYTGLGMIYVSGSSIGIRDSDLDQRIQDKTGISQPSNGGGGGGSNPFSDLGKGLSNVGSLLSGAVGGLFGGLAGGLAGGAVSSGAGLTSSGILSGVAAGISVAGAAVSIGSTLSHGFAYGSQGLSLGNLENNEGGWGFSFGNATLLYPDVYTDKLKSVAAIGYLKGSSNTTIVDSESPTTGTLCVLGGVGITKNLHVGGDLFTGDIALQYNTLFLASNNDVNHYVSHGMSNVAFPNYNIDGVVVQGGVGGGILGQTGQTALKWLNNVVTIPGRLDVAGSIYNGLDKVATEPFVHQSIALHGYSKTESDGRYLSISYQPPVVDLSPYALTANVYSKTESDASYMSIGYQPPPVDLSPYALTANVYSKAESNAKYKSIEWLPDLSNFYSRDEVNSITSQFAPLEFVYTKAAANQRFKPIEYEPNLSAYALKTALDDYLPWQVALDFYASKESVYTKSETDQTFVSNTFFNEFTLGVYTRDQADYTFAKFSDVYTRSESDGLYMPITYTPPASPDLSPYLLKTTADNLYKPINWEPNLSSYLTTSTANTLFKGINWQPDLSSYLTTSTANTLFKGINWQPDTNVYALKSDLNFVQPATLGSYYTKTQSDSRYILTGTPIVFPTGAGVDSSDGKRRFYFANNDRTYNYSPNGYEWRNADDSSSLLALENDGDLLTHNIALQYNTLFLALNNDNNHFISHGMSTVASSNYNIDGIVLQGGVGGGILAQAGTTALRWLDGVVTIPGSLKVSGGINMPEVSLLPKNTSTRPAFQVQPFMHDNVNIYFDANWDGNDLKASFGSFFKISKFNGNLWIGGGTGSIGSTANMSSFMQMTPSGQITLGNNTADALTITGGLKVGGSIYSGGNKVATEAFVNSAISASKTWENNGTLELNVSGGDSPCLIDFHSSSGADFNFRIFREAGADNVAWIVQKGTQPIIITSEATGLSLSPTNNANVTGGAIVFGSSVRHDAAVAISGYVSQTQMQAYKCLDVNGVAGVATTMAANVSLFCKYAVCSNTYFTHSDIRWKENIRAVPNLDAIDRIDAHVYDWKDETQPKNQIGFIAQEVIQYLPQCVRALPTTEEDDVPPLTVDYQAMSCFLWQVVKELKKEMAEIKRTIKGA